MWEFGKEWHTSMRVDGRRLRCVVLHSPSTVFWPMEIVRHKVREIGSVLYVTANDDTSKRY